MGQLELMSDTLGPTPTQHSSPLAMERGEPDHSTVCRIGNTQTHVVAAAVMPSYMCACSAKIQ